MQRLKKRGKLFFSYRNIRKLNDKMDNSKSALEWIKDYEDNITGLFQEEEDNFIESAINKDDIDILKTPTFDRIKGYHNRPCIHC